MIRSLALLALAACGSSTDHADAFTGPATVTLDDRAQGLVVSTPDGILCGQCATACPDEPAFSGSACSADFDAGTSVSLRLTGQQIYFQVYCSSPDDPAVTSCTFVVQHPMTVMLSGASALR